MMQGQSLLRRASVQAARVPVVVVTLTALIGLGALYVIGQPSAVPQHHHAAAGLSGGKVAVFLLSWTAMSAAMMLPSALSLLLAIERVGQGQRHPHLLPLYAGAAYLGVWTVVGVAILMAGEAAREFVLPHISPQAGAVFSGACLVAAGGFGLSPYANSCLRACRRPFGFMARHWRGGAGVGLQAARIGVAYGVSCVGCCVPMLALMFVVGMANTALVVVMAVLMVVVKSSAYGVQVSRLLAVLAIGSGIAVAAGLLHLPQHLH